MLAVRGSRERCGIYSANPCAGGRQDRSRGCFRWRARGRIDGKPRNSDRGELEQMLARLIGDESGKDESGKMKHYGHKLSVFIFSFF
jgi:hypothetical protein